MEPPIRPGLANQFQLARLTGVWRIVSEPWEDAGSSARHSAGADFPVAPPVRGASKTPM
jgi:hypothetical protein